MDRPKDQGACSLRVGTAPGWPDPDPHARNAGINDSAGRLRRGRLGKLGLTSSTFNSGGACFRLCPAAGRPNGSPGHMRNATELAIVKIQRRSRETGSTPAVTQCADLRTRRSSPI